MKHTVKGKRAFSNDNLVAYLQAQVTAGSSLLDLGCGPKMYSDPLRKQCSRVLTVDAWAWVEPDIVANLEITPLSEITTDRWDYVLMLDFIEHLDKLSGLALIKQVKQLVNQRIFLLTPLEEIWTENHENVDNPELWCHGNAYDLHKSLWVPEDFVNFTRVHLAGFDNYFVGYYEA
jgi:predicted TPR repeat methyltransferase